MSPRDRKSAGLALWMEATTAAGGASPLAPSPTAATTGLEAAHHRPGTQVDQFFGVSARAPLERVTRIETGVAEEEPARAWSAPAPSGYFAVGHTNE